jgi:hypothetical protein
MAPTVYEIIEGNAVDASSLGQLGDAIKRQFPRWKVGIDVDRIDDLILHASQRKPPSSPLHSPSAPLKTAPSMAPGIGGFNIDAPVRRASLARGDVAVAHMPPPASPRSNLVPQAPLQAQRMVENVESGESSLTLRLLAIIAIVGTLLLVFRDEVRNQLSDRMQSITSLCNVSNAETSVR